MDQKYNSGINIIGSIPNYSSMIEYIIEEYYGITGNGSFQFRASKSLKRFITGINDSILLFNNNEHKVLFYKALSSKEFTESEKFLLIFWQLTFANSLFYNITEEVFMKAVYQGRNTLSQDDINSYVRYLREKSPDQLNWAESTLKIIGSKYLTLMKKLGLAEGGLRKNICYPLISNALFVYFIRWCQCVCPSDHTINNPYIQFGFCDKKTLISRLKKIEFIKYWDIAQLNNEVTIELKPYE